MTVDLAVFLVCLGSTLFMTGVIWFVQLVHYPLMARIGEEEFADYQRDHMWQTSWIVVPVMLIEGLSALWLAIYPPEPLSATLLWTAFGMLAVLQLSTFALQVPVHFQLRHDRDEELVARLVSTNWIRTVLWTGRAVLMLYAAARLAGYASLGLS